jgi:hypothetical protein
VTAGVGLQLCGGGGVQGPRGSFAGDRISLGPACHRGFCEMRREEEEVVVVEEEEEGYLKQKSDE